MKKFLVIYEKTETGHSAYVPDIPGVIATGKTMPSIEKNIYEAINFHLEGLELEKLPVPKSNSVGETMVFA